MPIGHVIYKPPQWISRARFSPDEQLIAFMLHPVWGDDAGLVVVIDREGREVVRGDYFFSSSGLAWTPDGQEVWFAGELTARGRDLMSLDLAGKLRAVLPAPGRLTLHDIATDSRVLLATEAARARQWWAGRTTLRSATSPGSTGRACQASAATAVSSCSRNSPPRSRA